jgi:DNA repair protein RecO (recombination protein O)
MADFNVDAIVLRRSQYGETDNILTLYSRERGKFSAIAKGARKAISRLSGATELLTRSRFALAAARNLQIVRQAEVVDSYPELRHNLYRLATGLYAAELLSAFVTEEDVNPELFDLLASSLKMISVAKSVDRAARWFELNLLDQIGYLPVLDECTYCQISVNPLLAGITSLSASQGGVLCTRHAHPETSEDQSRLDPDALELLQRLSSVSNANDDYLSRVLDDNKQSDALAAIALRRYIRFRLDRDLKSIAFLDSVQEST